MIISDTETLITHQFEKVHPIEQIILVCDVDGVIRKRTDENADMRVISLLKELINLQNIDVAFISGTPITQSPFLETWRRGNITLDQALGLMLTPEVQNKKVTIYGALGGQRMTSDYQVEIVDEYPLNILFELGKLLLYAFLEEVAIDGTQQQKEIMKNLKLHIDKLVLKNHRQISSVTANEFAEIVFQIRLHLDPHFRLVSYGAFIESQSSNPPWNTFRSLNWIKSRLDDPHLLISQLPPEEKHVATGLAHRSNSSFNFLAINKINKGSTIKKHIKEKLLHYPHALIITIGDTQIDFPMHQHAHLAYHVGLEQVWKDCDLPQCFLVRDQYGNDSQHVDGTLHVLNIIKDGIGKPIGDWKLTVPL